MKTLAEYLGSFDKGEIVESVEMGGISEGYESAIQKCAIEIMRILQFIKLPEEPKEVGSVVSIAADNVVNELVGYGFSGAQVGAAKNIAAVFWRHSPEKGIDMMRKDDPKRIIKIVNQDGNCKIKTQ